MNRYDDMIPPFQESVVSRFWTRFSDSLVRVSFGVYCQTHAAYARATQVDVETCWHRPVGWAYEPLGPGWWDGRMARWWVIGFHCSSAFIQKRSLADCGLMIILPYHSDLPSYYHRVLLICMCVYIYIRIHVLIIIYVWWKLAFICLLFKSSLTLWDFFVSIRIMHHSYCYRSACQQTAFDQHPFIQISSNDQGNGSCLPQAPQV